MQHASSAAVTPGLRFVDIAVNLTDCVFRGVGWKGQRLHDDDLHHVLARARAVGVERVIISGTTLRQCQRAVDMCREHPGLLFCTVGVHPANSFEFLHPPEDDREPPVAGAPAPRPDSARDPAQGVDMAVARLRVEKLLQLIEANRDVVVAVGEVGLDYAEEHLTPRAVQHAAFELQMELAERTRLPMFLHSRDCAPDFATLVARHRHRFTTGVVHSFNGPPAELEAVLGLGLSVGLNLSAFRTKETAAACLTRIPIHRLMLETDAPWCDLRPDNFAAQFVGAHFPTRKKTAFVAGECVERRNEPCHIVQVLEACHGTMQALGLVLPDSATATRESLATAVFQNAMQMFFPTPEVPTSGDAGVLPPEG